MGTVPVIAALLGISLAAAQQPCVDYIEILQPTRSTNYSIGPLDFPLCDSRRFSRDTWHRFNSFVGGKIAEGCVEYGKCGTQGPIWMDGLHPTAADGVVERTVCANYGLDGDCCAWSATIQVLSCNDEFFVYKLANPPGCHLAYCAGDGRVCQANNVWSPELQHCIDPYPVLSRAHINIKNETTNYAGFNFECFVYYEPNQIKPSSTEMCVEFTLMFDGVEDFSIPERRECFADTSLGNVMVSFPGTHLRKHMGDNISCRVRTYWQSFFENRHYWSHPWYSDNTLNTELIVQNKPNYTSNSKSADFRLYSSVPVQCLTDSRCPTALIINAKRTILHTCLVVLNADRHASLSVQIKRNFAVQGKYVQRFDLFFPSIFPANEVSVFDNYTVPLQVHIDNLHGTRRCRSYLDPHYVDFDNWEKTKAGWLNPDDEVMNIGDFYMWRTVDRSVSFEVQVRHASCCLGSCICAVAIREGNDIIGVDACNSRPLRIIRYLRSSSDHDEALPTVTSSYRTTRITMPSGRRLSVFYDSFLDAKTRQRGKHLFVELIVPASDRELQSSGLCGNNNDIQDEVFDYESNNLHRVQADSIIFNGFYECIGTNETAYFCECNSDGSLNCGDKYLPIRTTGKTCVNNRGKWSVEKAQLDDDSDDFIGPDELYYNFEYDINATFIPPSWPTPAGKTRIQVESECERILTNSPVYEHCQNYTNVDMLLEACVLDTQVTDSWDFAHGMLLEFQSQCEAMIQDKSTAASEDDLVQDDVTGEWTTKLALQLLQDVCPYICLNGGTCRNRTCICMHGFSGETCAVETNKAPEMVGLQGGGLCDVRQRSCQKTRVFATNLLNSPGLTCRAVVASSQIPLLSAATYYRDEELACHHALSSVLLPGRGGDATEAPSTHQTLHLSITNDKSMYSNTLSLTIYDSVCIRCYSNHTCIPINDACNIGGRCYRHMETHPGDSSLYCDAISSTTTWSEAPDKCCEWGDWQECSREHCLRRRDRECESRYCLEKNFEVEWCTDCYVPELQENIHQGITLVIAAYESQKVLQNIQEIAVHLANSVNQYCSKHPEECCEQLKMEAFQGDGRNVTLTSANRIVFAQGYPKVASNNRFSLKWIAYVWPTKVLESCQGGSFNLEYVPSRILYDATLAHMSLLEQALNAQILDIHTNTEPEPEVLTLPLTIVLPLAILTLLCLVLCICCMVRQLKNSRTIRHEGKPETKYVVSSGKIPYMPSNNNETLPIKD